MICLVGATRPTVLAMLLTSVLLAPMPTAANQPEPEKPAAVELAPAAAKPAAPDAADHDALRKLRDELIKAVNEKNREAVLALLHPNVALTAQDGKDLKVVRGRDGVGDYLDRLLLGPNRGVQSLKIDPKVDDLAVLYHGDTAVAFGSSDDHYQLTSGAAFDLKTRWSATAVKEGDHWLLANLHVSTNLFDNPVVRSVAQFTMWISLAAGMAGLLIGLVIGKFMLGQKAAK